MSQMFSEIIFTNQDCVTELHVGATNTAFFVAPSTGSAKADIVLVHGLTEHPGRYFSTARILAREGFRTILPILSGHGGAGPDFALCRPVYEAYARSTGSRETMRELKLSRKVVELASNRGFHRRQYRLLRRTTAAAQVHQVQTVLAVLGGIRQTHTGADTPLFLVGHSLGALLCSSAVIGSTQGIALSGIALLSPALRPHAQPDSPVQKWVLAKAWEQRKRGTGVLRKLVKAVSRLPLSLDVEWSSRWTSDIPDEVELYRVDPLVHKRIPLCYLNSVETLMATVDAQLQDWAVPTLILSADQDMIAGGQGAVLFAARFAASFPGMVRLRQYRETTAHELLRSSRRDQAIADIVHWSNDTCSKPSSSRRPNTLPGNPPPIVNPIPPTGASNQESIPVGENA